MSKTPRTVIVLSPDRYKALSVVMTERGLEPSLSETPDVVNETFLPDTMPRRPVTEKYAKDGGSEWPARWMFKVA